MIQDGWIERVANAPEHEQIQPDGRIRRWARIPEGATRYLRVVVLADGETIRNAFFDREFKRGSMLDASAYRSQCQPRPCSCPCDPTPPFLAAATTSLQQPRCRNYSSKKRTSGIG